jgi:mannobiose 2-epimerase
MTRLIVAVFLVASSVASGFGNGLSANQTMERLDRYPPRIESELRENILPYWLKHARDRDRGGFHGQLDDGTGISKDAPRGALLTTRIIWTFSAAYRQYPDPAYLEMARWAFDDLMARFWDEKHGGLYWSITADGVPLNSQKLIYVQAFGIYGLVEYHLATGDRLPLERAVDLYRVVEKYSHDQKNRGYFEEFSRDWKKLRARGPRESAMGSLGQKSQNVHLHVLEAYTNLLRAWSDEGLKKNLAELVDVMLTRIVQFSGNHLNLFFEEDWAPTSHEVSYGHDLEFSWLITEAAEVLGDPAVRERAKQTALNIATATLREGVEPNGGVVAEGGAHGVTNTFKEWWSQAEGAVGFANAFQLSGDPAFLDASMKTWDFIDKHVVDHKNGEWFIGRLGNGRVPSPAKISFWKCPYHNGRACMELIRRYRTISSP